MMKITGLSHLFKWENLHNWWLNKYFFAPLYVCARAGSGQQDLVLVRLYMRFSETNGLGALR